MNASSSLAIRSSRRGDLVAAAMLQADDARKKIGPALGTPGRPFQSYRIRGSHIARLAPGDEDQYRPAWLMKRFRRGRENCNSTRGVAFLARCGVKVQLSAINADHSGRDISTILDQYAIGQVTLAKSDRQDVEAIAVRGSMKDLQEVSNWKLDLQLFREVFRESKGSASIRILVVEDCDEDFFLITRCLNAMREYEASITRASDLESARRMAARAQFDLAIIDYWLGEDTGPHVLRSLGGRGGRIPAILVTGLDHPAYKRAGLKAGAIHSMSKDMLTGTGLQDVIRGVLYTHKLEAGAQARDAI